MCDKYIVCLYIMSWFTSYAFKLDNVYHRLKAGKERHWKHAPQVTSSLQQVSVTVADFSNTLGSTASSDLAGANKRKFCHKLHFLFITKHNNIAREIIR